MTEQEAVQQEEAQQELSQEQPIVMQITIGPDGDPLFATNIELPIPIAVGFLELTQQKLTMSYHGAIARVRQAQMAEQQRLESLRKQFIDEAVRKR